MWRLSHRTDKPFYDSSTNKTRGHIRILCEAPETISHDNKCLLDDAFKEMPNQKLKIEICCKSIDDDTLCAFRRVILLNESLQWIQMPEAGFTNAGLQQLCQCLERATCLVALTLQKAKLTDAALPSLIAMIERSNSPFVALQRLQLPSCSFSEEKWIQLFQSLTDNRTCSNFQFLSSRLTDEVIPAICKFLEDNKTLFQLRVQGLENQGAVSLCQALSTNTTVRSISLGYGPDLSEEATSSLCEMLVTNTSLRILSIEDNKRKLTSDVLQKLFDILQNNTTMANVWLAGYMSNNNILQFAEMLKLNTTCTHIGMRTECTPERLTEVWKALAADKKIERLKFQNVTLVDSVISRVCQFIRCNNSVETFDLGQARLSAEGLDKVLHALLQNPNWQNFELQGSRIEDESVDHLCQLIQTNSTLQKLIITWSRLNATEVEQLCKLLSDNTSIKELLLDMKGLRCDTLVYLSALLGTGLESFRSEDTISDAEFNLIIGIVKDNPCIVEAKVDPIDHQLNFKYRGIEGAQHIGKGHLRPHQSAH